MSEIIIIVSCVLCVLLNTVVITLCILRTVNYVKSQKSNEKSKIHKSEAPQLKYKYNKLDSLRKYYRNLLKKYPNIINKSCRWSSTAMELASDNEIQTASGLFETSLACIEVLSENTLRLSNELQHLRTHAELHNAPACNLDDLKETDKRFNYLAYKSFYQDLLGRKPIKKIIESKNYDYNRILKLYLKLNKTKHEDLDPIKLFYIYLISATQNLQEP